MTYIERIDKLALNTLEGFLLSLGITPSEDGLVFADFGPHRVYTVQGLLDCPSEHRLDVDCVFRRLEKYLRHHNHYAKAPHFDAYEVICGYHNREKNRLYVSISHTA